MRSVNKVIYILLALFLGGIGIHKFYAGKNVMGVIYILLSFVGISIFLALFDIIVAVFKPSDCNGNIYL